MSHNRALRIGGGSAYGTDRVEPAVMLAEQGDLDYICLDSLAERTLPHAHLRKLANPALGYDLRLEKLMRGLLPSTADGLKIIGNMGAANPPAAAERVKAIAAELGLNDLAIAVVTGDDVLDVVRELDVKLDDGRRLSEVEGVVAANAYLGADAIVEGLQQGAQVVITGRVADPSLFLAPMLHEFGWAADDWRLKGAGQTVGHLIECAGYVTGAHFADPPYRVVPELWRLGFPLAEVEDNGEAVITKVEGTGGLVSVNTCKAQLVYELHDPAAYLTPDVTVDVRNVRFEAMGENRVRVRGAGGQERPAQLKVLVGVHDGYIWEGEIGYSGSTALACAQLAETCLRERMKIWKAENRIEKFRFDYIGINSANQAATPPRETPYEMRLRFAGLTRDEELAQLMAQEVEWLYMGPNGGGGVRTSVKPTIGMYATYVPREVVYPKVSVERVSA